MRTQVKVTAIAADGRTVTCGWFDGLEYGEQYAEAMVRRGYVVVKQYR